MIFLTLLLYLSEESMRFLMYLLLSSISIGIHSRQIVTLSDGPDPANRSETTSPSLGWNDNDPIVDVTWDDVNAYAKWAGIPLPTEAEWEFAARGGTKTSNYTYSGSNTIGDVAWCYSNSGSSTHTVGTKSANELGIYDMSGNVWEWCADWYGSYSSIAQIDPTGPTSGTYHILRGGSWAGGNVVGGLCRVAGRGVNDPDYRGSGGGGFRLLRRKEDLSPDNAGSR
jgi:formylglycine-generating enzyme required for sulfatase activity